MTSCKFKGATATMVLANFAHQDALAVDSEMFTECSIEQDDNLSGEVGDPDLPEKAVESEGPLTSCHGTKCSSGVPVLRGADLPDPPGHLQTNESAWVDLLEDIEMEVPLNDVDYDLSDSGHYDAETSSLPVRFSYWRLLTPTEPGLDRAYLLREHLSETADVERKDISKPSRAERLIRNLARRYPNFRPHCNDTRSASERGPIQRYWFLEDVSTEQRVSPACLKGPLVRGTVANAPVEGQGTESAMVGEAQTSDCDETIAEYDLQSAEDTHEGPSSNGNSGVHSNPKRILSSWRDAEVMQRSKRPRGSCMTLLLSPASVSRPPPIPSLDLFGDASDSTLALAMRDMSFSGNLAELPFEQAASSDVLFSSASNGLSSVSSIVVALPWSGAILGDKLGPNSAEKPSPKAGLIAEGI